MLLQSYSFSSVNLQPIIFNYYHNVRKIICYYSQLPNKWLKKWMSHDSSSRYLTTIISILPLPSLSFLLWLSMVQYYCQRYYCHLTISIGTKLTRARGFLTIINTRWPHSWENGMLSFYLHTTTHTTDWLIWFTTTHTTIKQYPLSFSLHQNGKKKIGQITLQENPSTIYPPIRKTHDQSINPAGKTFVINHPGNPMYNFMRTNNPCTRAFTVCWFK